MFECPNSDQRMRGAGIPYIYKGTYKTFYEARKAIEQGEYIFHIDNYNADKTVTHFRCKYYNSSSRCQVRGKIETINDEYKAHLSEHSHGDHPERIKEVIRMDPMIKEFIKRNIYRLHQYRGKEIIQRLKDMGQNIKDEPKVLRICYKQKKAYRSTFYSKIHDTMINILNDEVLTDLVSEMFMCINIVKKRNDEDLPVNYILNRMDVLLINIKNECINSKNNTKHMAKRQKSI